MKFGEILKNLRKEKAITQNKLAEYLKFTRSTIANYETGRKEPELETLKKIAEFFNVSTDFLLGLSNIREPYNKLNEYTPKDYEMINKTKELSPEGLKELDEMIDLLKYKDMMKKEKEHMEKNKSS